MGLSKKKDHLLEFPKGFLWGVSTSHFQVEGNPVEMATKCSDWAAWTHANGNIADHTTADRACEFYSRYPSDLELISQLNLNALRISLNWASICPGPLVSNGNGGKSQPNQKELDHYRRLLTAAKEKGIKTFVSLFHFCLPLWLSKKGGWHNEAAVHEFDAFAELVANEYKGLVDYWVTINEPLAYAYQGYIVGNWPPGSKASYAGAFTVIRNMLEAHGAAYHTIHSKDPHALVSFTMHWRPFPAQNELNPLDRMVSFFRNSIFNHIFPTAAATGLLEFPFPFTLSDLVQKISGYIPVAKDTMDFLGINYYTLTPCSFKWAFPVDLFGIGTDVDRAGFNPLNWESYPQGLYDVLIKEMPRYKFDGKGNERPIIITENGYADMFSADLIEGDWSLNDDERTKYLHEHLVAVHRAIKSGANVTGYLHWSLLDNFEWAEGLRMRFGLVRVAFPTQERTFRKSAGFYSQIARQNAIKNGLSL
jgi:beta-glucosidase